MKCFRVHLLLIVALASIVLCGSASADDREPAPPFTMQTLDGQTFTNSSLSGRVVLLQFWATWCPYCRRDQSAVDNVERAFADQGLIVLAVDVGESEQTVRRYLDSNPRACRIVVNDGRALAARFGSRGYPYYVLIDADGNIAGTQGGSGGESSLRNLLSRAGLPPRSDTPRHEKQSSAAVSSAPTVTSSAPTVIDVPSLPNVPPRTPTPKSTPKSTPKFTQKTIFVFTNGERLEADQYTLDAHSLRVAVGGGQRTIPLSSLDVKATIALNHERGIDLKIPKAQNEAVVTF